MPRQLIHIVSVAVTLSASHCGITAWAQKPPGLGYAFPPVVAAGQTTDIQLGGFDFTPDMQWFLYDARAKLEILGPLGDYHLPPPPFWFGPRAITAAPPIPREVPGRVVVSADANAGPVRWQVANANGSSGTAMLFVSRGREIVERRSRDLPQRLDAFPVGVSGRLSRFTEVDRYEFVADRDSLATVELMAARLGANFNGVLEARDTTGKLLTDHADTLGIDGAIAFAVRRDTVYTVSLHDADFRGDRAYVYHLAFRYGPRVLATLPARGQRGATREVEFVGIGLATGQARVESIRQTVTFPSDPELKTLAHALQTPAGTIDVEIPLSDLDERTRGPGTADSPGKTLALSAPCGLTARFESGETEYRYTWHAEKDQTWTVAATSRAIGGRVDVAVAVLDPTGKLLDDSDDSGGTTDALATIRTAAPGEHTCVVRAMSAMGGPDDVYRLEIARPAAGFTLSTTQQVNLPLGGKAELAVLAARNGGWDGPIALTMDGLPEGVKTEGELVIAAGKNEAKISLVCAADAAVVAAPLAIRGTATLGDETITRTAMAPAGGNLAPRTADEQRVDRVLLAITMTPPVELKLVDGERQRDVPRGSTCRPEFDIVRKNGFAGELRIEMAAQQDRQRQGVRGPIVVVPPEASRVVYPCFMPEWLSTDLTRRVLVSGVAVVNDPKGNPRHLVQPGTGRITMIMEGALMKLTPKAGELTARPGDSFDVPVAVARSAKFPAEATVELVVPEELVGAISAEPLKLTAKDDRGTLRIATKPDARLSGDWPLTLTATALEDGKWPVVSQTEIVVRFPAVR